MKRKTLAISSVGALIGAALLLSIPSGAPDLPAPADGEPYRLDADPRWQALQARFEALRAEPPAGLAEQAAAGLADLDGQLDALAAQPATTPDDPRLAALESSVFELGPALVVCARAADLVPRYERLRALAKRDSQRWDLAQLPARQRLYRLLYGCRMALEELLLQSGSAAPGALSHAPEPVGSQTPSVELAGVRVHSGDLLLTRGGAPTSALIARGSDLPGNFSHVALVHVDPDGEAHVVESLIETGVVVHDAEAFLADHKLRILLLRPRPDLPALVDDPQLPHTVATAALEAARAGHIPYDFAMDHVDHSKQFCSEVASSHYAAHGIDLWQGLTRMSSPGVVRWLGTFGVRHVETHGPSDLEYDPQLSVVVEWRDADALWQDHVDNAVIDAMLEGAEAGDPVGHDWYLLAPTRVTKAWSLLLNACGRVGPVPEGMSSTTALQALWLEATHHALRAQVLEQAAAFEDARGYRPPYWDLRELARQALEATR